MQTTRIRAAVALLLCTASLAACGGGDRAAVPPQGPQAHSPARIKPAPMVMTKQLPPSAMHTVKPAADFAGSGWSQIPGSATQAAAAPDGSLWVLSTDPAGSTDKYIWHFANGQWINIPGLASQLAPAPDGSLYVINTGGGTWHYVNGSWVGLGGGAQAISIANDGSAYVVSNDGSGSIWQNSSGTWRFIGGSGTMLAANVDPGSYAIGGGNVGPYGLFVVNSSGQIYYTTGTSPYLHFPGAASSIATTVGGFYVLAYPTNPGGNQIYYYDYNKQTWKAEPGSGVSISANSQAAYVVSANGSIYTTPLVQPLTINLSTLALTGVGSANLGHFALSGGTAPYSAGGYDSSIVSVAVNPYSFNIFDVTPLKAGATTVTVHDSAGATATIQVTVTTATGVIQ